MPNEYQRALREFQDYSDDVSRSRHRTFDDAIGRFASVFDPNKPLGLVATRLPYVDFDIWYEEQQASVGGMIGSGRLSWPDDQSERLSLQVELVRRLASRDVDFIHFITTFMYVRNNFDDNTSEFVQQVFRPFVRDFLRLAHDDVEFEAHLQGRDSSSGPFPMAEDLTLFISHSSRDVEIAKALITLFEKALKISARKIRCTSVDGYRLPAGADTNDVLRAEVFGATLFVGLITPTSLASPYVLFELGARWGARKPLFPVLAAGAMARDLHPPLSGLNALSASIVDQVRQLVEDTAATLNTRLEPISTFSSEVDLVVAASNRVL
jgi:hypothetical protein